MESPSEKRRTEPSTHLAFFIRVQNCWARSLEFGAWSLEPGTRSLELCLGNYKAKKDGVWQNLGYENYTHSLDWGLCFLLTLKSLSAQEGVAALTWRTWRQLCTCVFLHTEVAEAGSHTFHGTGKQLSVQLHPCTDHPVVEFYVQPICLSSVYHSHSCHFNALQTETFILLRKTKHCYTKWMWKLSIASG